ncbi:hypothetical protein Tco_0920714 [Tanacetum coccineum]
MSGSLQPIPLPLGTSSGTDVFDENLLQLVDSRGGSHVTNVLAFDKEDFTSWKVRFLVFLDGLKPYLSKTLEGGPFVPMSSLSTSENQLPKHQNQWSNAESRLSNQDKRLKSIIISCLPNDVMKSVIKYKTAKQMWNDLILAHKGPSDTRDTKIASLRLKFNAFKSLEGEKSLLAIKKRKTVHFQKGLSFINKFSTPSILPLTTPSTNPTSRHHSTKHLPETLDKESVSSKDEGTTKIRAFMAIAEDEPSIGKADA